MLWKVEGTNLHIIGSVHISQKVLELPAAMISAVNAASILAFEANFDHASNPTLGRYDKKSDSLSKKISATLYIDSLKLWENHGLPIEDLEQLHPWRAALALMNGILLNAGFSRASGIDGFIMNVAKRNGKKLFFLESVNAGLVPFMTAPHAEIEKMLHKAVYDSGEGVRDTVSMVEAWKSSDLSVFELILDKASVLMPVTYSSLVAGRNRAWLPQLIRLIKSNKCVVVVVGALHMVGNDNIPQLLEKKGFSCHRV